MISPTTAVTEQASSLSWLRHVSDTPAIVVVLLVLAMLAALLVTAVRGAGGTHRPPRPRQAQPRDAADRP